MPDLDASASTSFANPSGTAATPGQTITVHNSYSVSVPANQTTQDLVITDELSANLPQAYVNVTGGTYNAGIITWDIGAEVAGSKGLVAIGDAQATITIPQDYGQSDIVSIATITTPPGDVNPANNESTATIGVVRFRSGTSIRTAGGDVSVEDLRVGDLAVTASGATRPIVWLGHREVSCANHPDARSIWPVRIAAEAFGRGLPERDLYVSPGHSLCVTVVEPMLIQAADLINGATIQRVPVDTVDYWHVELESHDILGEWPAPLKLSRRQ